MQGRFSAPLMATASRRDRFSIDARHTQRSLHPSSHTDTRPARLRASVSRVLSLGLLVALATLSLSSTAVKADETANSWSFSDFQSIPPVSLLEVSSAYTFYDPAEHRDTGEIGWTPPPPPTTCSKDTCPFVDGVCCANGFSCCPKGSVCLPLNANEGFKDQKCGALPMPHKMIDRDCADLCALRKCERMVAQGRKPCPPCPCPEEKLRDPGLITPPPVQQQAALMRAKPHLFVDPAVQQQLQQPEDDECKQPQADNSKCKSRFPVTPLPHVDMSDQEDADKKKANTSGMVDTASLIANLSALAPNGSIAVETFKRILDRLKSSPPLATSTIIVVPQGASPAPETDVPRNGPTPAPSGPLFKIDIDSVARTISQLGKYATNAQIREVITKFAALEEIKPNATAATASSPSAAAARFPARHAHQAPQPPRLAAATPARPSHRHARFAQPDSSELPAETSESAAPGPAPTSASTNATGEPMVPEPAVKLTPPVQDLASGVVTSSDFSKAAMEAVRGFISTIKGELEQLKSRQDDNENLRLRGMLNKARADLKLMKSQVNILAARKLKAEKKALETAKKDVVQEQATKDKEHKDSEALSKSLEKKRLKYEQLRKDRINAFDADQKTRVAVLKAAAQEAKKKQKQAAELIRKNQEKAAKLSASAEAAEKKTQAQIDKISEQDAKSDAKVNTALQSLQEQKNKFKEQKKLNEEKHKKFAADRAAEQDAKTRLAKKVRAEAQQEEAGKKLEADKKLAETISQQGEQDQKRELSQMTDDEKAKLKAEAEEAVKRGPAPVAPAGVALTNLYQPIGFPFLTPSLVRRGDLCVLSGVAVTEQLETRVAVLPEFCRPHDRHIFSVIAANGRTVRIDIDSDGIMRWEAGAKGSSYLPLDGISFAVKGSNQTRAVVPSPWTNRHGYAKAKYYKDEHLCVVSGVVKIPDLKQWANPNNIVAILPSECRPVGGKITFLTNQNGHNIVLDVYWTGEIRYVSGAKKENWVSLDGISFFTEAADTKLKLNKGWNSTLKAYREPQYRLEDGVCGLIGSVSGAVKPTHKTFNAIITTLPKNCAPADRLIFSVPMNGRPARVDVLPNGQVLFVPYLALSADDEVKESVADINLESIKFEPLLSRRHDSTNTTMDYAARQAQEAEYQRELEQFRLAVPVSHVLRPLSNLVPFKYAHPKTIYSDFAVPAFTILSDLCLLSGAFRFDDLSKQRHIADIPFPCWPSGRSSFAAPVGGGLVAQIDVFANGSVYFTGGSNLAAPSAASAGSVVNANSYLALDGIGFASASAEQAKGKSIDLVNGWKNAGGEYAQATSLQEGELCFLNGFIRLDGEWTDKHDEFGALDPSCHPEDGDILVQTSHGPYKHTLRITTDGRIEFAGGPRQPAEISLAGIVFITAQKNKKALKLEPVYRLPEKVTVRRPGYVRQGPICVLSGSVEASASAFSASSHDASAVIATLPDECRPVGGKRLYSVALGADQAVGIEVLTSGVVRWSKQATRPSAAQGSLLLSLDGIHFTIDVQFAGRVNAYLTKQKERVESAKPFSDKLKLLNHFTPFDDALVGGAAPGKNAKSSGPYTSPHWSLVGRVCYLSGLARALDLTKASTVLPEFCRPQSRLVFHVLLSHTRSIRVDIFTNGTVLYKAGDASNALPDNSVRAPSARSRQRELRSGMFTFDGINFAVPQLPSFEPAEDDDDKPVNETELALRKNREPKFTLMGVPLGAQPMDLGSGWTNKRKGFSNASYYIDGELCYLSGVVRAEYLKGTIAQLPYTCRPKGGRIIFTAAHGAKSHRVDVDETGKLIWVAGVQSLDWVSLNGISFYTGADSKPLKLGPGWSAFGDGFKAPTWAKQGSVCALSGVVKTERDGMLSIAQLPDECRPSTRLVFSVNHQESNERIDILPSGEVRWVEGSKVAGWLSLDNIRFVLDAQFSATQSALRDRAAGVYARSLKRAIAAKPLSQRLNLTQQFAPFNRDAKRNGTDPAEADLLDTQAFPAFYTRVGSLCFLYGAVKTLNNGDDEDSVIPGPDKAKAMQAWPITILPARCRPRARVTFAVVSGGKSASEEFAAVSIMPSGEVRVVKSDPNAQWVSLDEIVFPVGYSFDASSGEPRNKKPWRADKNGMFVAKRKSLSLLGAWSNFGSPREVANYMKQGELCALSGTIRVPLLSDWSPVLAILPPDCRPRDGFLSFTVVSGGLPHRVTIEDTGRVVWVKGQLKHPFITLDGIMFFTGYSLVPTPVLVAGGGSALKHFREPSFTQQGAICLVTGVTKVPRGAVNLSTLPLGCRPLAGLQAFLGLHLDFPVRLEVSTSGTLSSTPNSIQEGWLSFDGVRMISDATFVGKVLAAQEKRIAAAQKQLLKAIEAAPTGSILAEHLVSNAEAMRKGFGIPVMQLINGMCFLSGVIARPNADVLGQNGPLLNLPAQCRPQGAVQINTILNEATGAGVEVRGDGVVTVSKLSADGANSPTASNDSGYPWLGLNNIIFPTQNVSANTTQLTLLNGWGNFAGGSAQASVYSVGEFCVVQGLISSNTWKRHIATLPPRCRPQRGTLSFSVNSEGNTERVDVDGRGRILWRGGSRRSKTLSLAGISFVAGKYVIPSKLKLKAGFIAAPRSSGPRFRRPAVYIQGSICSVSGRVTVRPTPETAAQPVNETLLVLAQLPLDCRPSLGRLVFGANSGSRLERIDVDASGRLLWASGNRLLGKGTFSLDGIVFVRNREFEYQMQRNQTEADRKNELAAQAAARAEAKVRVDQVAQEILDLQKQLADQREAAATQAREQEQAIKAEQQAEMAVRTAERALIAAQQLVQEREKQWESYRPLNPEKMKPPSYVKDAELAAKLAASNRATVEAKLAQFQKNAAAAAKEAKADAASLLAVSEQLTEDPIVRQAREEIANAQAAEIKAAEALKKEKQRFVDSVNKKNAENEQKRVKSLNEARAQLNQTSSRVLSVKKTLVDRQQTVVAAKSKAALAKSQLERTAVRTKTAVLQRKQLVAAARKVSKQLERQEAKSINARLRKAKRKAAKAIRRAKMAVAAEEARKDKERVMCMPNKKASGLRLLSDAAVGVAPVARWNFYEKNYKDVVGNLHAQLSGEAAFTARGVALAPGSFLTTPRLMRPVQAKTLEVFVILNDNLKQRDAQIMTIRLPTTIAASTQNFSATGVPSRKNSAIGQLKGSKKASLAGPYVFDAISYGKGEAQKWQADSNNDARTSRVGGRVEKRAGRKLTQIAITYKIDGTIAIYRNGRVYRRAYNKNPSVRIQTPQDGLARMSRIRRQMVENMQRQRLAKLQTRIRDDYRRRRRTARRLARLRSKALLAKKLQRLGKAKKPPAGKTNTKAKNKRKRRGGKKKNRRRKGRKSRKGRKKNRKQGAQSVAKAKAAFIELVGSAAAAPARPAARPAAPAARPAAPPSKPAPSTKPTSVAKPSPLAKAVKAVASVAKAVAGVAGKVLGKLTGKAAPKPTAKPAASPKGKADAKAKAPAKGKAPVAKGKAPAKGKALAKGKAPAKAKAKPDAKGKASAKAKAKPKSAVGKAIAKIKGAIKKAVKKLTGKDKKGAKKKAAGKKAAKKKAAGKKSAKKKAAKKKAAKKGKKLSKKKKGKKKKAGKNAGKKKAAAKKKGKKASKKKHSKKRAAKKRGKKAANKAAKKSSTAAKKKGKKKAAKKKGKKGPGAEEDEDDEEDENEPKVVKVVPMKKLMKALVRKKRMVGVPKYREGDADIVFGGNVNATLVSARLYDRALTRREVLRSYSLFAVCPKMLTKARVQLDVARQKALAAQLAARRSLDAVLMARRAKAENAIRKAREMSSAYQKKVRDQQAEDAHKANRQRAKQTKADSAAKKLQAEANKLAQDRAARTLAADEDSKQAAKLRMAALQAKAARIKMAQFQKRAEKRLLKAESARKKDLEQVGKAGQKAREVAERSSAVSDEEKEKAGIYKVQQVKILRQEQEGKAELARSNKIFEEKRKQAELEGKEASAFEAGLKKDAEQQHKHHSRALEEMKKAESKAAKKLYDAKKAAAQANADKTKVAQQRRENEIALEKSQAATVQENSGKKQQEQDQKALLQRVAKQAEEEIEASQQLQSAKTESTRVRLTLEPNDALVASATKSLRERQLIEEGVKQAILKLKARTAARITELRRAEKLEQEAEQRAKHEEQDAKEALADEADQKAAEQGVKKAQDAIQGAKDRIAYLTKVSAQQNEELIKRNETASKDLAFFLNSEAGVKKTENEKRAKIEQAAMAVKKAIAHEADAKHKKAKLQQQAKAAKEKMIADDKFSRFQEAKVKDREQTLKKSLYRISQDLKGSSTAVESAKAEEEGVKTSNYKRKQQELKAQLEFKEKLRVAKQAEADGKKNEQRTKSGSQQQLEETKRIERLSARAQRIKMEFDKESADNRKHKARKDEESGKAKARVKNAEIRVKAVEKMYLQRQQMKKEQLTKAQDTYKKARHAAFVAKKKAAEQKKALAKTIAKQRRMAAKAAAKRKRAAEVQRRLSVMESKNKQTTAKHEASQKKLKAKVDKAKAIAQKQAQLADKLRKKAAARQRAEAQRWKAQWKAARKRAARNRRIRAAQRRLQRIAQKAALARVRCVKPQRKPSALAGQWSTPVFNYYPGWNFVSAWEFNSRSTIHGDFNGDGKADYARLGATYVHFFISKGDGSYHQPVYPFPAGWNFGWNENVWTTIGALDLNGDGKSDFVRSYSTYQHSFLVTGSNQDCWHRTGWIPHSCMRPTVYYYPRGWSFSGAWSFNNPRATVIGDFNGDGKDDYARLGATYMHLFISKGDGQFYRPVYYFPKGWNFGWDENGWTTLKGNFAGNCRTSIIRTSGRYHHGFLSVGSDKTCWKRNGYIPAGCFKITTYWYPHGWNFLYGWGWNSRSQVTGDFNGDGLTDFARVGGQYIHFFINRGDGVFNYPIYRFPHGWNYWRWAKPKDNAGWWGWGGWMKYPFSGWPPGHWWKFQESSWTVLPPGDFDGDGKTDILRSSYTFQHGFYMRGSNQRCWFRNGDIPASCIQITQYFYPKGWNFANSWSWDSQAVRVLDINGDGKDDVLNLGGGQYNHQFIAQ